MILKEIRLNTPDENLQAAVSILQMQVLAQHSEIDAKALFGGSYMPGLVMDVALGLLSPLLSEVDGLIWLDQKQGGKA